MRQPSRLSAAVVGLLWLLGCGPLETPIAEVTVCGVPQGPALPPLAPPSDAQQAFFAAHPPPSLVNQGGPVLRNMRVVAVFFGDDPLRQQTEALLKSYGCTRYWREAVGEYAVGDFTYSRSVVLDAFPERNASVDRFSA